MPVAHSMCTTPRGPEAAAVASRRGRVAVLQMNHATTNWRVRRKNHAQATGRLQLPFRSLQEQVPAWQKKGHGGNTGKRTRLQILLQPTRKHGGPSPEAIAPPHVSRATSALRLSSCIVSSHLSQLIACHCRSDKSACSCHGAVLDDHAKFCLRPRCAKLREAFPWLLPRAPCSVILQPQLVY